MPPQAPGPVFNPDIFAPDAAPPAAPAPLAVPAFISPVYTGSGQPGTQLFYSSAQFQTAVVADNGSSLTISTTAGLPQQYPFKLLLEWGTVNQEVVMVTSAPSGNGPYTFSGVLRAMDGGGPQIIHAPGAQVNHGVSAADFGQIAPMFNVCDYDADPTGTVDSAPAIQAALNAAAGVGIVWFPAGTFLVGSTLQIPGFSVLQGAGHPVTTVRMKAGANLPAIAASSGWLGSINLFSVWYCLISGIFFDGNKANQAGGSGHGIVLQTFGSYISNCVFQNTLGDGLRFDYYGANGITALIDNAAVENRVTSCQFRYNGGIGLHVNDPSHNAFTDGFIRECIVASAANQAICIDAAAGWSIEACHLYGTGGSALVANTPFMTRIIGNYIESWGQSTTPGTYTAIDLANPYLINDNGSGTAVTGNTVNMNVAPGSATTLMRGIGAGAVSGGQANLAITDNILTAIDNTYPANYTAIWLMAQSGTATLNATVAGTLINGNWGAGTLVTVPNGGTISVTKTVPTDVNGNATVSGSGQPALAVSTSATASFVTLVNFLASSVTAGQTVLFNLGRDTGNYDAATWSFTYAGAGSTSNSMAFNFFGSAVFFSITGAGVVSTQHNTLDDGGGGMALAGQLKPAAGTTALTPLLFQSGTLNTTPVAGAVEYDGVSAYITNDTTSGRGQVPVEQRFRLTATGSTIGTSIANYFGTTSNISLVSGAEYEIEIDCWFLKTTAGTVTWTFTNSAAPTSMTLDYQMSPATGIVSTPGATDLFGQQYNITTTAPTVVSPSLTTLVNHRHRFWIRLINGTGTSLKIQATCGAGSITPGINSYWRARRVPLANVGTFSA